MIDNLSESQANHRSEFDRLKKNFGSDSQKIEELSAKIEMLMKRDQKSVHFVGDQSNQVNQELAANDSYDQADMNLIGGQGNNKKGFNQNFKSQNQQNLLSNSSFAKKTLEQIDCYQLAYF